MRTFSIVSRCILACISLVLLSSCETLEEFATLVNTKTTEIAAGQDGRKIESEWDADNWDLSLLDTARGVDYLAAREKNVVLELNKVRTNPKKYADLYLVPTLRYYQGKELRYPGRIIILTNEGRSAVDECIRILSSMRPLKPLLPSMPLYLAAKDHAQDTGPKGIVGHTGSDGSSLLVRIKRHDKELRTIAETINYGNDEAREIVKSLIIDDGVLGRGHRKIILTPGYDCVGLSIGSHKSYGHVCVIDYAKSK